MDIATLLGFFIAVIVIAAAILTGGSLTLFVDLPSVLIVVGGTFGASLMRLSMADFLRSFGVAGRAFINRQTDPNLLIDEAVLLAETARKNGLLALESIEITDPFMKKGVRLCVDGYNPAFVQNLLQQDIDLMVSRNEVGQNMWKGVADLAPAMAVALLTTLYGAVIANVFALPMIDKLASVQNYEKANKELVMNFIANLQDGTNPKVLRALLNTYIAEKKRQED